MVNREAVVIAVAFLLGLLATLAVILRFQARRVKQAGLGADDWTIVGALLFSLVTSVACLVGAFKARLGQHDVDAKGRPTSTPADIETTTMLAFILHLACAAASGLTKVSVLLFYKRLFLNQLSNVVFRHSLNIMLIFCALWTLAFSLMSLLSCKPISDYWAAEPGTGNCVNLILLLTVQVVSDLVTDVMILLLPWFPLRKMQVPLRKKIVVASIFLLGAFTVVSGILRAYEFAAGFATLSGDLDYIYAYAPLFYWTNIQSCVGVISACLPCLAPIAIVASIRYEEIRQVVMRSAQSLSSSFKSGHRDTNGLDDEESLRRTRENSSTSMAETNRERGRIIRADSWTLETGSGITSDDIDHCAHSKQYAHVRTQDL